MGKRKLGALEKIDADLPSLQHKIRTDPDSYRGDFQQQYGQYRNFLEIYMQAPAAAPDDNVISLRDLIDFIAHVSHCYPDITKDFARDLANLLTNHHDTLEAELRDKAVGSLVLLRKKNIIDSTVLLNTLFPILISTSSKALRSLLYQKIISDVRVANAKAAQHKLNRTLQTILHNLLTSDRSSPKAIWAVRLTRELWRRQVWTDSKAVDVMKEAALAEKEKVIVGAVRFFLDGDKDREEAADDSSDEEGIDMAKLRHQYGINKKTNKKEKELRIAAATVKKKERRNKLAHPLNFSALHLLHDPQGFAESLFSKHLQSNKSRLSLEQKLLVLQLVSRLVGLHKLIIISLYSYFLKYLTPRQTSVTSFLASVAQSTHNLVPPDIVEPLVRKIANEFVSEASAGQVAAAGLNAIREICARQPLAMNDTLLQDLVLYRKSKDKGVMMAAKGLLSLYRDVGADLLKKRDRGRDVALSMRAGDRKEQRYGQEALGAIEGLELLEKWKEERRLEKDLETGKLPKEGQDEEEDEEQNWAAWEIQNDDSSDSGGWIEVHSDDEDIVVSDSDEPRPPNKKLKTSQASSSKHNTVEEVRTDLIANTHIVSNLATTRILTPADLAKLNELRAAAAVGKLLRGSKGRQDRTQASGNTDDAVTAENIERAAALGAKASKTEKIAAAKADREERHQSATARRKEKKLVDGKSTTNKEKARKKNFLMTLSKARGKQKRSLREVGRVLKDHMERSRRGGKRGNKGV